MYSCPDTDIDLDFASCLIHGKCYSKIHKVRDVGLHPMVRKTDLV